MDIPRQYRHITPEFHPPRIIEEAVKLYGVHEAPGENNDNPIIMQWADELSADPKFKAVTKIFYGDVVPWCGLFVAIVAHRAGWGDQMPDTPLWAQSWLKFGNKIEPDDASLGDILVYGRNGGGHVGLYVGHDSTHFHTLGGNQSDQVNIVRIAKSRLLGVRRPKWRIAQPATVIPYRISSSSTSNSTKEN